MRVVLNGGTLSPGIVRPAVAWLGWELLMAWRLLAQNGRDKSPPRISASPITPTITGGRNANPNRQFVVASTLHGGHRYGAGSESARRAFGASRLFPATTRHTGKPRMPTQEPSPDSATAAAMVDVAPLCAALRERLTGEARVVVIAGSGLGGFARRVKARATVAYSDLPGVGASTVQGHTGQPRAWRGGGRAYFPDERTSSPLRGGFARRVHAAAARAARREGRGSRRRSRTRRAGSTRRSMWAT